MCGEVPLSGCIVGSKVDDLHVGLPDWVIHVRPAGTLVVSPTMTVTTTGTGSFRFDGLEPGQWVVWEEMQLGWSAVTSPEFEVTVLSGMECTEVRFKNRQTPPGCLQGWKVDQDDQGVHDWTIQAWQVEGGTSALPREVETDVTGFFQFNGLEPGQWVVQEEQRDGWSPMSADTFTVTVPAGAQCASVRFQNRLVGYKLFLPFATRQTPPPPPPPPEPCSIRKLRVEYGGMSSDMDFALWPGPTYSNILLGWGRPIDFSMVDGEPVQGSYLGWYKGYKVKGPGPTWSFVAPSSGAHPSPGALYWFSVWYEDQGEICTLMIPMQWDPPEGSIEALSAEGIKRFDPRTGEYK